MERISGSGREERCFGLFVSCDYGQAKATGYRHESDFEICRQRLGELVGEAAPDVVIGLDGRVIGAPGSNRTGEVEFSFFGDTAAATYEPIDLGMEGRRAGGCSAGNVDLNWKEHFVFVAEIHQGAERKALGDGKLKRSGGDSLRQCPFDVGRFTGVAGVFPVDMPSGFEFEVEARVVGRTGMKLSIGAYELHVDVGQVSGTGGGECGDGRGEQHGERDDRSEESHAE